MKLVKWLLARWVYWKVQLPLMWDKAGVDDTNPALDDYNGKFTWHLDLAPAIWLTIVWVFMVGMLGAVGYLAVDDAADGFKALEEKLKETTADFPSRRAGMAFSGVTLAITVALSIASCFWAGAAARFCASQYWMRVLRWVSCYLLVVLLVTFILTYSLEPFTSKLGKLLLTPSSSHVEKLAVGWIPNLMLALSCVVPCVLLAGASFLIQPMAFPTFGNPLPVSPQIASLAVRLRELDQMLYIGALALVFGTLQLSSGLSLPLASLPKSADLKVRMELCKGMAPPSASIASSAPFFAPIDSDGAKARLKVAESVVASKNAASAAVADASTFLKESAEAAQSRGKALVAFEEQCQDLPKAFARLDDADGLRQLVRGVTLSFGLAFSALLAAIYVPALVILRDMLEKRQRLLPATASSSVGSVDLPARIAAVIATLSPVFAGLIANVFSGG